MKSHGIDQYDRNINILKLITITGWISSLSFLFVALKNKMVRAAPSRMCIAIKMGLIFTFIYWAFFFYLTLSGEDGDGIMRGGMCILYPFIFIGVCQYTSPQSGSIDLTDHVIYVGFWDRLIASIVDFAWQTPMIIFLGFIVYGPAYFTHPYTIFARPFDLFLHYGLPFILTIGFWFVKAATPGKMVIKAVIVNESDFKSVSVGRLVLRYFGYIISFMFFGLGFIWISFDSKKQGWHDKIAKTVVIYK